MNLNDVIEFWFSHKPNWFVKSDDFDQLIKDQFLDTYTTLLDKNITAESPTAMDILAVIIVLDQFSRNMFRDTVKMFASDHKALV